MSLIQEHSAGIKAELAEKDVHKKMPVFYNPLMKSNRSLSILLLNTIAKKNLRIADLLAGSGMRSLRFLMELKKNKIKEIVVNDFKENFRSVFEENLKLNGINEINEIKKTSRISIKNQEASLFLLQEQGFDYIDIDPFGSPNPFLAAAVARISRGGILAVTATDTAALSGTYPKVTQRKYWARPMRNYLMHEIGLRILIRKIQLQGMQFDKALAPILSYHKNHYFRVYFVSAKGKEECDKLIKQQQYFLFCGKCLNFTVSDFNCGNCECGQSLSFAGPLWTGKLFDSVLVNLMAKNNPFPEEQKFINLLKEESKIDVVGFYDLHVWAKRYRTEPKKMEVALQQWEGVRTHFSPTGIKSEKSVSQMLKSKF